MKAGKAHKVQLVLTNTGPLAIAVQTDARTSATSQVAVGAAVRRLLVLVAAECRGAERHTWVSGAAGHLEVGTDRLINGARPGRAATAHSVGIDLFGDLQAAQDGSTVSTATVSEHSPAKVGQGFWGTYVQEIGPYGDGGAPAGETTLTAVATTAGFDSAVTTSTGDPFLASVDPTADTGKPVVVKAGGSVVITVTITPTAKVGKTVKGVLHLVRPPAVVANLFYTTGDILANLPYSYTVS